MRGKMKDIACFLREKRVEMVGEGKERLSKSKPKVQLKYEDARDCGMRKQRTRHAVVTPT